MASTQEVKGQLIASIGQVREMQGGAQSVRETVAELDITSSLENIGKVGAAALALSKSSTEVGAHTVEKNVTTAEETYRLGLTGTENDDVKKLFANLVAAKESLTGTEGVSAEMGAYATVLEEVGNLVMAGVAHLEKEAVAATAAADQAGTETIGHGEQIIDATEAYMAIL